MHSWNTNGPPKKIAQNRIMLKVNIQVSADYDSNETLGVLDLWAIDILKQIITSLQALLSQHLFITFQPGASRVHPPITSGIPPHLHIDLDAHAALLSSLRARLHLLPQGQIGGRRCNCYSIRAMLSSLHFTRSLDDESNERECERNSTILIPVTQQAYHTRDYLTGVLGTSWSWNYKIRVSAPASCLSTSLQAQNHKINHSRTRMARASKSDKRNARLSLFEPVRPMFHPPPNSRVSLYLLSFLSSLSARIVSLSVSSTNALPSCTY